MLIQALTLLSASAVLADSTEIEQGWSGELPAQSAPFGATESHYRVAMTRTELDNENFAQLGLGRQMVDIEMVFNGTSNEFTAVWKPVSGLVFPLFEGTQLQYDAWLADTTSRAGRYLDVEVTVRNGAYRYNGLFLQDGNDYEPDIRTRRSESAFRDLLASHARDGYQLIDIEVGPNNSTGATVYSGVWVRHRNQPKTAVLYDLTSAEYIALLNPISGRVLDVERYTSDLHGQTRYAMIIAMVPGDTWAVFRNISQSTLATQQGNLADGNTYLIDLDPVPGSSNYDAVWGEDVKTLRQVAAISNETLPISPDEATMIQIGDFEDNDRLNVVGLYGRNLTTGASVGYRMDESFPLASTMKTAVHFRLWKAVADGERNSASTAQYTIGANNRQLWYTGNNTSGLGTAQFGMSFNLSTYSQMMMTVSDNAATSLLVDHASLGTAVLNENLSDWLAGIDGVGQGWGPLISIQSVDRHISREGQVRDYPNDASLFTAPPWALEARFRASDPNGSQWLLSEGGDFFGDLAPVYAPAPIPESNMIAGHERFHDSGLNSATPRAVARLFQAFIEDNIVPASTSTTAKLLMGQADVLLRHPEFPRADEAYSKSGGKGDELIPVTRILSDSAFFRVGNDWFTFAILGKHLSYTSTQLRATNGGRYVNLSQRMLRTVAPNLEACEDSQLFSSVSSISAGTQFAVSCAVTNNSLAPSPGFDVEFRLSTDSTITDADPLLGVVSFPSMTPQQSFMVTWQGVLPPGTAPGAYRLGVAVDGTYPTTNAVANGAVGEWLESYDDNTAVSTFTLSVVNAADPVFANGFE